MSTTLTRNLKLRLSSSLTSDAQYNLERLDALGGTVVIDSTEDTLLRLSKLGLTTDIRPAQLGQVGNLVFTLPNSAGTAGQVLVTDGSGNLSWFSVAGSGTVTSVDLSVPTEFTLSGNPITTAGTIVISKSNQAANLVYAGPSSGPAAQPTFRALVAADISGIVGRRTLVTTWLTADGTTKTVTHGWGTQTISVEVLDTASNYANIQVDSVTRPTGNTTVLVSTEAPASSWTILLREVT